MNEYDNFEYTKQSFTTVYSLFFHSKNDWLDDFIRLLLILNQHLSSKSNDRDEHSFLKYAASEIENGNKFALTMSLEYRVPITSDLNLFWIYLKSS